MFNLYGHENAEMQKKKERKKGGGEFDDATL